MDYIMTIITTLLSGGLIFTIYEMIKYRKENKSIKQDQATQSKVDAQKAEIDLANLYKEEMLKVINLIKENTGNQVDMKETLSTLDKRMERVEIKMSDIEGYLNGPYHEYLAKKESPKSKKK